jgi:hypothetical protein
MKAEANSKNAGLMNEIQQFNQINEQLRSRHNTELQQLHNQLKVG